MNFIDIQSWWEVPCIAHFCSLFSSSFQLPDFDIEDLEEALLTNADTESEVDLKVYSARLLPDLIVALLKGCDALNQIASHISPSNYQMFLRRLFRQKCQEYNIDNPFNEDTDFEKLPLRTKILILKYLCDFRLDSADVYNSFANLEPDSLRVEPLGFDSKGSAYWYFFGTRLYREDYHVSTGKGHKSSNKRSVWQVICFTEEDWRNLVVKFKRSRHESDRALLEQLEENFLPNIPKIFRDKERERRNKLLERRTSSRIKTFEERRLADIYRQKEIEEAAEAQKALLKEQRKLVVVKPEPQPEDIRSQRVKLAEDRARRAERRSRSNSVSSIVSTYASSPEPLTSDFIFQPKESETLAFSKHSSSGAKHAATVIVSNPPASPSSELGSEPSSSADIAVYSGGGSKQDPEEVFEEDNENSENNDYDDDEEEEDSARVIVVDQVNNNFTEVGSSVSVVSGTTTTSSGISSREQREKTPSTPPTPPPPVEGPTQPEPVKRRSKLSAEIEALLQYNRNMAPTTTKLPGRQTNNSLSSVTGPVILPFADTPPPTKTSGSKNSESNTAAAGSAGGSVANAAVTGGRKKKSKASEVFTETEEVLQIGMHKVLEHIKNHDDAWPFMDPVDEDIAPRYYSIIRRPMDLLKMEEKLDNGEYLTFGDFRNDFKLIVNNCRLYNGQANEYTEMVNNLQIAFEKATKKYFDSNSSDEEPTLEYPIFKEKPFGSSGGKNINESTGGSASATNSKSSSENNSDNSKKSSGVKNKNSAKDTKSDKDVKSDKKEGKAKNSNKKGNNEIDESSFVGKKQNSETDGSAKKDKASGDTEPKGGKNDNAKGSKRKRKEKDKVGKGKSKKFKPNKSEEEEESEEGEDKEDITGLKEHMDSEEEICRSPTPVPPPESKNKVNSKVKKKEEKVKEKTKIAKGKKEDKKLAKTEVSKRGRKKSPSRSRSVSRSPSKSPVPRSVSPPKNAKGKKEDKKLTKSEVGKKGRKKSPPRSQSVSRLRTESPMSRSPSPPPASSSKRAEKRKDTSKLKHSKKERKDDRSTDREVGNAEITPIKQADTSMSSGSPSPVKGRGRKKAQEKKAENQSDTEDHVDHPIDGDDDKETDLSNFADIDEIRVRNDSRGYASEESVEHLPASDDGKKSKRNKKGGQKAGKTGKGKNKNEEKSKKSKSKGKSGKSRKSKSSKSFDTSSLVSSSNEEQAIEEAPKEQKSKSKPAETEIKSASKKQPKDFSKYTTLPRDRSSSRSFSRSPSPLPSIRGGYSSMSDHSMDFDDDDDLSGGRISAPARPITPDIRDKYDLIKERRRNQQKATSQTGAPVTTPTNEKPIKQKHRPQETSRKKQKPNQTQSTSSSASPNPSSKQQKVTEECEKSTRTKETGKSKRKRDRSSESNRDSPVPEEIKEWTPPEPLPIVEKPRPSYKDEKTEKRECERKIDPSDEYDFVDDSPPQIPTPKAATPIPSPVEKLLKPPKVKTESSRRQMQKSTKSSQQHASLKPNTAPANKQPKTTGANMEALELETEQTLKDINKWLENTPRFSEYSSASNSPSRYIMDELDAVTAKIDAADFRKPIPLPQLPEEESETPIIPIAQAVVVPPPLITLPAAIPSLPTSPKAMIPPALPTPKEPSKLKHPKELLQDINPLKESVNITNISASHPVVTKPHPPPVPPVATVPPPVHSTVPILAAAPAERPHLGPPQIIPPHSQKKEPKEPKRKTLKEKLSQLGSRKRDTVHHRLDRLQPGKSKGNLLGTIQNINKPEELFPLGGGPNKLKEVKNSLIVKTDESKPKLSLGTVLNTGGFGLGQQHNFADEKKENAGDVAEDKVTKKESGLDQSLNSSKDDDSANAAKLLIHEDIKAVKAELAKTDPSKVVVTPEKANKAAVNKSDKPSATPNLSAWFKAFGAPKKPKKPEDGEEGASKNSPPESGKDGANTSPSESGLNVPLVPSLESPSYPSLPAPRQRKASTGSTVSERSSFSQDPDSPRIGIDERIGVYPAPYPSPMGASPIMTSPKLDDTQKSPYPLNGAIKVGFYQDTTTKSSPEKSCSPRDLPSPYPQYSQHLYSSNSGMTANNLYGNYAYSGNANATSTNTVADNFKSFDQYKQPASQESDYNSSMSPSTNPNSPYHNQQSSPYQQQPNSPYQQQQPNQNFNQQQQQQPIASPASSGPLSPYSTNSIAPQSSVQQSPAQSVSGHSPFNPSPTSPYQTPQHQPQSQSPQVQKPNQQLQQQSQPQQHPSKPNTPIHQSPNSPFSQSNHSSPYSQQDPNSPYSQGQLSPFQPMSPKPPQSSLPAVPQGTTNNSLKLAPPIITPQQAAAAAGVTLPESPVNNLSQQPQQTSPQQQQQQQQPQPQVQNTGSQLPIPQPQPQIPPQLNTQTPWNQQPPTYNQYGTPTDNSIGMGSNLPAPAHMHHHQQQAQSQPQQQQKPQPAHHNVQQQMQPQLLSQQQQQQQSQLQQQQQPTSCQQQSQHQHQAPNLSNLTPAHSQQQQQPQQQHSHLSNLLSNNPYTSNYGRQAYDPIGQNSHVGQDVSKTAATKVPELINLGYNSGGSTDNSASTNKPQPHQQEMPMNMGNKQSAADQGPTKEKELTKQQQMFELMGAMGYTNPMDISISKTKAFDMFNRAATMTFPRGFPGPGSSGTTASGSQAQQQEVSKMSYGANTTGYEQIHANPSKAHDMSGATAYNMQQSHQPQAKPNQTDLIAGGGNSRGNVVAGSYDQRTSGNVQQQQQQQLTQQQQQQANMDLSAGYKSFSGASSSSLMDPALRNLASLSSLYQSDATSGFYDKNMPPAAHMFGKNLSNHPVGASSVAASTTSTLQQMFNSSMATTMAYNAAARDQQTAYGSNYHQRSDILNQGQKVPLNIPTVANPTAATATVPEPTKPKRSRKKKDATQDLMQQQMQHQQQAHQHQQTQPNAAHQGFQAYPGHKTSQSSTSASSQPPSASSAPGNVGSNSSGNSEPSAISLKTANVVPGSAFNFGTGPAGLGLPSSLYGENSPYLDEFRNNPNPYPYLASSHRGSTASGAVASTDGSEKSLNPSASTASAVAAVASAVAAVHQPPPAASPYHQFLSHPSSRAPYQFMNQLDPLHQQYIRQEELRAQMMLNQSLGLGAPGTHVPPPGAYGQPGAAYHHALGMHKPYDAMNSMNRPPWL